MEPEKLGDLLKLTSPAFDRCERCGRGVRHYDREIGQRKWCKRCIDAWYRRQKLDPIKAERQIIELVEPLYAAADIDNFDNDLQDKMLALKEGDDVFITGPVGVGKTYLMAAMIRHYIYEGYECQRISFDNFCIELRSIMMPNSNISEWDMIEPLKNVDKLFIDDLGLRAKEESDYAYVILYSVLNKRQERLLPTFVSSNKNLVRLNEVFDYRIVSRLQTAVIIEMKGKDRRQYVLEK